MSNNANPSPSQKSLLKNVATGLGAVMYYAALTTRRLTQMQDDNVFKPFWPMLTQSATDIDMLKPEQIEAALTRLTHHRERLECKYRDLLSIMDKTEDGLRQLQKGSN